MTEPGAGPQRPSRSRLTALRVGELRELALALGVGNVSTMRKGSLVDAIDEHYDTTDPERRDDAPAEQVAEQQQDPQGEPQADEPQPADEQAPAEQPADEQAPAEQPAGEQAPAEQPAGEQAVGEQPAAEQPAASDEQQAPEQPADESQAPEGDAAVEQAPEQPAAEQPASDEQPAEPVSTEPATAAENAASEAEGGAETPDEVADAIGTGDPKPAAQHVNAGITGIAEDLQELQREAGETGEGQGEGDGERQGSRRGRGRGRGRGAAAQNPQGQNPQAQNPQAQQPPQEAPKADAAPAAQPEKQGGQPQGGQAAQQAQAQDGEGRRGRYRDRKRRGQNDFDEPEIRDDDVLIPIAGILDVLDNYAFVRTSGYLSGTNDVYVSLGQVKKYHLRKGDAVVGAIRQVPDSEQSTRQKYNALVKVDSINGLPVADAETRVEFDALTPLHPAERLRLETEPSKLSARVVDLIAPLGKGSRGLVVAPPKAGKTVLLQSIAGAITKNNPEVHLMVVLVDERPEEVTDLQRSVKGEVIASTFDRSPEDHTTVAELAIERAKRLVELGYDVVVLLDSLTRLVKAYDRTVTPSGRAVAVGLDAAALQPAKAFFGAARNVENGGSLTVIASATDAATSAVDAAVIEEFSAAANLELHLDGGLAAKRIFPAVHVTASGTRREEALMGPDEVKVIWQLRRALAGLEPQAALDVVLGTMRETGSNVEFLVQMQKNLPTAGK